MQNKATGVPKKRVPEYLLHFVIKFSKPLFLIQYHFEQVDSAESVLKPTVHSITVNWPAGKIMIINSDRRQQQFCNVRSKNKLEMMEQISFIVIKFS